ncbi:MAG: hypothetical protein Q8M97_07010 [Methanobacteriaceae archaeon]|nr:hypothetical protein [Methanobacteriaceae archaeon]MDP3624796.1 hypothetical protein [Methanobacteriaceae archaeon]
MNIKIKYLIIGIIGMAIVTALWRLSIFNDVYSNIGDSISYLTTLGFLLLLAIPIIIGYKSKGNPIIFGFILGVTNLTIDQILLNQNTQNLLSSTETRSTALYMISTGELHFLPTIENTILVIFLSIVLTFIGTSFNKKFTQQPIED